MSWCATVLIIMINCDECVKTISIKMNLNLDRICVSFFLEFLDGSGKDKIEKSARGKSYLLLGVFQFFLKMNLRSHKFDLNPTPLFVLFSRPTPPPPNMRTFLYNSFMISAL